MTSTRTFGRAFVAASLMGAAACAPAIQHSGGSSAPSREMVEPSAGGARSDRIAAIELASVRGKTTADAVRQLRPEFLRVADQRTGHATSSTAPSIYVNGRYAGEVTVLDLIPLSRVVEIRYLGSVAARSLFGSYCQCEHGVIFVRTAH